MSIAPLCRSSNCKYCGDIIDVRDTVCLHCASICPVCGVPNRACYWYRQKRKLKGEKTRYNVTRTPNFEVTIERVPLREVPVKRKHGKHKKVP